MSGPSKPTAPLATLDTCVLVPGGQRDFLLQLAVDGGFRPVWSSGTLSELDATIARLDERRGKPDRPEARRRLLDAMRSAFPGSTIEAERESSYDYDLKDLGDGHVAHAAITSGSSILVTDDTKAGFKTSDSLNNARVTVQLVQEFAAAVVRADPEAGLRALHELSARQSRPPRTPSEILDDLANRYHMTDVADILQGLL